jgi:hypothetical protein
MCGIACFKQELTYLELEETVAERSCRNNTLVSPTIQYVYIMYCT